jgi:hypothetical protein
MLGLRFRLKIFKRHPRHRTREPKVVSVIGVPADVPYDERVYRVSFKLDRIPLKHRIVLELSPGGERISKFHLEFN